MKIKCTVIFVFTAIFLLTAFTACQKKPVPEESLPLRSGNFETTANISYKELKATATITRETPKSCIVVFTSPESIKDMAFVYSEGNVDLSYKGMSFSFDPDSLPGRAIANIAIAGINKAMEADGFSLDYTGNALVLTGVMESGEFTMRLDKESGNLIKLSVPAEDLEIEFVNFSFLD